MKKLTTCILIIALLGLPAMASAGAPRGIAGIVLGETIDTCREDLQMETELPIRYKPYLKEVQIKATPGFKSGLVIYENCHAPGRIVRIKMKYADSSKSFYEALLKRFKQRFGSDMEWRGDPFHIVQAWKWRFIDDQGRQISLILQHNKMDEDQKKGNAIKLTYYDAMNQAEACYRTKHPMETAYESKGSDGRVDWDALIPR